MFRRHRGLVVPLEGAGHIVRRDGRIQVENNTRSKSCQDISTIVAIAIVAWALFAVLHEIVGHGGAAFFLGEKVLGAVSTTVHIMDFYDLSHVVDRIGWWGFRVVAAAATAVNLATGALALLLL